MLCLTLAGAFYTRSCRCHRQINRFVPASVSVRNQDMVRNSNTYTWVTVWSAVCLPIILWDACYAFFRSAISRPFCFPALTLVPQSKVYAWGRPPLDLAWIRDLPGGRPCTFSHPARSALLDRQVIAEHWVLTVAVLCNRFMA